MLDYAVAATLLLVAILVACLRRTQNRERLTQWAKENGWRVESHKALCNDMTKGTDVYRAELEHVASGERRTAIVVCRAQGVLTPAGIDVALEELEAPARRGAAAPGS
jgi:hypothetical protein